VAGLRGGRGGGKLTHKTLIRPAAVRQGYAKSYFAGIKKNSINTKPATQPLLLYIFFIRLSSAQSAFYLPSTPPTAMARRSPLS